MAQWFLPNSSDKHGWRAESVVAKALRAALSSRLYCDVHAQVPVSSNHLRVPDFLILDRELGLIVIEVKGLVCAQVESVAGDCWKVRNYFGKTQIHPFRQATDAIDMLSESGPCNAAPRRVCVVLPYISEREWRLAGHRVSGMILFKEDLGAGLLERLWALTSIGQNADWSADCFHRWQIHLSGRMREDSTPMRKKGAFAHELGSYVSSRDRQLRGDAIDVPNGVYRVRGIAGSGKTTLLTQSAAWMLFNNPSSRIGFVYHSRSLFDHCFSLVMESLQKLADARGMEVVFDRKDGKIGLAGESGAIRVFNSWGSAESCGFYRFVCSQLDERPMSFGEAEVEFGRRFGGRPSGSDLLPLACLDLLKRREKDVPQYFDAVFIDEAQDLIADRGELKHEGREPFFWLAYCALKSVSFAKPSQRRLIFAYDEAQSLGTLHIPSAKQLFGEDLNTLFVGGRNRIMRCCYRNPKPILIAAHILGMGFLRERGAVQGLNASEWDAIGYEVAGAFRSGSLVTLSRTDENTPNPTPQDQRRDCIALADHQTEAEELDALRRMLWQDLLKQDLQPSRDILVICLRGDERRVKQAVERPLSDGRQIHCFIPGDRTCVNEFWRAGHVTVTNIWRAKGNEAPMIYITGLEALADNADNRSSMVCSRNKFFVSLTRAQAWVHISGLSLTLAAKTLFEEVRSVAGMVQSSSSAVEFIYRKDRQFRNLDHEEQVELVLA